MSTVADRTDHRPTAPEQPPAPWVRRIASILSQGSPGHDEARVCEAVIQVWQRARALGWQVTDGIAVHRARLALQREGRP